MPSDPTIDTTAPASWKEIWRSGHVARFLVLCFGVWLHAADFALTATLLPDAVLEIGGVRLLNWSISLYQLGAIVAGTTAGMMAIRFGLARALIGGASIYVAGCATSAMAPSMEIILIGRILQGVGGGFLVALVLVGVNSLIPSRMAPRVLAVVSVVWGSSAFIGPLIGGLFAEAGIWRGGFWAFGIQGLLFIAAVLVVLRGATVSDARSVRLPVRRLLLLVFAVLSVSMSGAVSEGGGSGLETPLYAIAGVVLLGLFLWRDSRAGESRLLPRHAISFGRRTGAGTLLVLCMAAPTIAFTVYGPLLLKILYGVSPIQAGYILALGSVAWTVGAVVFSGVSQARERWVILAGPVVVMAAISGLALTVPNTGVAAIAPFVFMEGLGFGMAYAFIVRRVVESAAVDDKERASGAMATMQQIGYAFGAAASGIVANGMGFSQGVSVDAARAGGAWIFAAFLPLTLFAVVAAWRLGFGRAYEEKTG